MKKATVALACGLFMMSGLGAHAEQFPSVLTSADVVIENVSGEPLACGLLYAHWYRKDFKTMAPGASVTLPLKFSPPTEAVYVINSVKRPMAVQDLFCSSVGADWKQVSHFDYRALAIRASDLGAPLRLKCLRDGPGISCESHTQ